MANKSISQLTAGGAVSGTDLFPDVQTAGVGPVKVTATQLATFFWYQPTLVNPSLGAATATSINIGGATLGSNVLAVNGTTLLGGATTVSTGGLTIGVAGTTGGTIALKGSTAGTLTLQVPATVTDYSITLPSAVAAGNGYILTSTTGGVTSWTNPTSLGIDLDVGTTAITNGAAGRLLFQGAGDVLQESANLTFSTAALTLGVQDPAGLAGVQGSLILANTAAGAFSTTLQASNSASAAWTLTLPISAGTNNYVLTTNGSGVSSWSQVSLTAGVTGTLPVANGGTGTATAFTAGSVVFAGASGVYSQDNANFFWDDSNNRLGIGTISPTSPITLSLNTTSPPTALSGTMAHIVAADGSSPRVATESFAQGGQFAFRRANGTNASPSALAANDLIGNIAAFGYGATGYATGNRGFIGFYAAENWTDSAQGSYLGFATSATGAASAPEKMRLDPSGNLLLGGTAARGTTPGSAHLDLFNGTAPAGTLTNGISLYSSSGDFYFMDAAGSGYKVGFRNVPAVGTKTSSYQLATADVGKYVQVSTGGAITIPDATFAEGDIISIFNNTSGNITITCSITTAYIAGTDTDKATMTLATRGVATVLFISSTVCVVSGNVS